MPLNKIILASASPRRKQLLEQAELIFEIVTQPTEEDYPITMALENVPEFIATKKASAVQNFVNDNATFIGADTIVLLENEIIGKPNNKQGAIDTLTKLSGKMHKVITGVCIISNGKTHTFKDVTEVTFNQLNYQQIEHYVRNYKPYDKAGAYAIQEWIGVIGIKKIDGCFYNVMGLPVSKVLAILNTL